MPPSFFKRKWEERVRNLEGENNDKRARITREQADIERVEERISDIKKRQITYSAYMEVLEKERLEAEEERLRAREVVWKQKNARGDDNVRTTEYADAQEERARAERIMMRQSRRLKDIDVLVCHVMNGGHAYEPQFSSTDKSAGNFHCVHCHVVRKNVHTIDHSRFPLDADESE